MGNVLKSLITFDTSKVDPMKGVRQGLLLISPALLGYFLGNFALGLFVSTGTLAHIYVFKSSPRSMIRTVILCSLSFAVCMILGTLTVTEPILYGVTLLLVTVIPYYIFSALKIAGPSSTFFLVTFCLPSNLPIAPNEALYRGLAILVGGAIATLVVILTILFQKQKIENRAINLDFNMIKELMHNYNDVDKFKESAKTAVTQFKNSDELLITATAGVNQKLSPRFQRLLLLHSSAQGLYSELLELHEKGIRPIPDELVEMMDVAIRNAYRTTASREKWTKEVHVDEAFDDLLQYILKIDEITNLDSSQIEHEASVRKPLYSQRIIHNLTLDSIVFRNTLIYAVIMAVAIFISLAFNIQKSYWIPLTAHTVLLGMTTRRMLDRSVARGLGTILGTLVLSAILYFNPHLIIAVIIMGIAAMVTETFVGSNYAFAVIFITIQVILLNGLASDNLSISIAYTRIFDVLIGIAIAVVGILLINRQTASAMLPRTIAEVVRKEAVIFQYLFSENHYQDDLRERDESLALSVKMSNMIQINNSASDELFSNQEVIRYYYPSIFALEEINFMLMRVMQDHQRQRILDQQMGEYLVTFENLAKHFELQSRLEINELFDLPQYNYIKSALMRLQNNCVHTRKDIDDVENGVAIKA